MSLSIAEEFYHPALTLGSIAALNLPCLTSRMSSDSTLGPLKKLGYPFNLRTSVLDKHFSFSIKNVLEGRYYTCVTCLFNHVDGTHFGGNMTFLVASGYDLHVRYGRKHMLSSFIGGGIAGCTAQFLLYLYQQIKWENFLPTAKSWSFIGHIFGGTVTTQLAQLQKSVLSNIFTKVNAWRPCVGCSAGLAGLMAVQACTNIVALVEQMRGPGLKLDINLFYQLSQLSFTTLVIYEDISILFYSSLTGKNLLGNLVAYSVDGVGHAAHLGGFLFGFLYYYFIIYRKVIPKDY